MYDVYMNLSKVIKSTAGVLTSLASLGYSGGSVITDTEQALLWPAVIICLLAIVPLILIILFLFTKFF